MFDLFKQGQNRMSKTANGSMFLRVSPAMRSAGSRFLIRLLSGTLLAAALVACEDPGSAPVAPPRITCDDPSILKLAARPISKHSKWKKVRGTPANLPAGMTWAKASKVQDFFGGKPVKVVFTLNRRMYLAEYAAGAEVVLTTISSDDEGLDSLQGSINSPLFSPDGRKIVYAGTTRGKPAFIRDAVGGDAEAIRVPLDPKARVTADPHWHVEDGKTYVYFSTLPGLVAYQSGCGQVAGSTYRSRVIDDTTVAFPEITGIPGSYRGGLSKDGIWAGTSYSSTTLYNRNRDTTLLLAGGMQQCNPSMNPFPAGSRRSDYIMVLAFGETPYTLITGGTILEGLHENLWIYNQDDKVVWQAKRENEAVYERYDKPEWSTHPAYATAVAIRRADGDGDLFVVRIGDLADAEEGELNQAQGYLKIGEGGFTSDSYSHLWVGE